MTRNSMIRVLLGMMTLLIIISSYFVDADIAFQQVDQSSGIWLNKKLDVELKDAVVVIDADKGQLESTFKVYSNEKTAVRVKVYLRAKGESCYNDKCWDVNPAIRGLGETSFHIDGEFVEGEEYNLSEGVFASSKEFTLEPGKITIIEVSQAIYLPYEYYLDSLSAFTKADHEIITIKGAVTPEFNEHYPVKKMSENEFVWEYSNIDTSDENLRAILIIKSNQEIVPHPIPAPELSFLERIIDWFKGIIF